MPRAVLSVRELYFVRAVDGNVVLEDLTFTIYEGERVALLGPNGCGKTTLLELVLGRLVPSQGDIDVTTEKIGYVDQELVLFPWLTVRGNILFGLNRRGVANALQEVLLSALRARVEIDDIIDKYPNRLSGGMRQRAVLARALVDSPDLMLLDEPFSALDSYAKSAFYALFKNLPSTTCLFVTHDPSEAVELSTRIIVLRGGNGKPGRLLSELSLSEEDLAARRNTENTLRILLAHGSREPFPEDEVLSLERSAEPGDLVVIVTWELRRASSHVFGRTMSDNIRRGVRYLFVVPDLLSAPEKLYSEVETQSEMTTTVLKNCLDVRVVPGLKFYATSHEYVFIERCGKVLAAWEYPVPFDYRYAFSLSYVMLRDLRQAIGVSGGAI